MAESKRTIVREINGDLFSCPSSASLAHCISEDAHMGKGIATLFKRKFGGVDAIKSQKAQTGEIAVLERADRFVYYLITKRRYFHKPTYDTLRSALTAMKIHAVAHEIDEICMPRIGCGLDKLDWDRVKRLLESEFRETKIQITVYYL